jgi:outer membrane protein
MTVHRSGRATPFVALALLAIALRPAHADAVRLTLGDALARADHASAALGALSAQRDASAAGARKELGARLPQVTLSAGYTRLSNVDAFTPPGFSTPLFPNLPNSSLARADLALPVFTGLRLENNASAAGHDRAAAEQDLAAGRGALRLETVRAYWELVATRSALAASERALAALDAHGKAARDRKAQGLVAANEVLAVDVARERTELVQLRASAAVEVAGANLARLVGLPDDTDFALDPADSADADTTVAAADALVARALAHRPELRAADERTRAAEKRKGAAQGALLPQVSLLASALTARPNDRFLPRTDSWNSSWSVGVSASWSILDGGRSWADAAQRAAQARAAELGEEDLARRVRQDVTARRLDLASAVRAQAVAESAVESAHENERVARDRYRAGVLASSDLLDAEVATREAELDLARATADRRVARAALAYAVGD